VLAVAWNTDGQSHELPLCAFCGAMEGGGNSRWAGGKGVRSAALLPEWEVHSLLQGRRAEKVYFIGR
jgi:hypothetical protein